MMVMRAGAPKVRIDELLFAPTGATLVTPIGAAGVSLWRTFANGAKAEILHPPVPSAKRLAFAPDGRTLFVGNDRLCALDLVSGAGVPVEVPAWASLWFGVSPDGTRLVIVESPKPTEGTRLTLRATNALGAPTREVLFSSLVYSPPLFLPTGDHFVLLEGTLLPSRQWEYRGVTRMTATGEMSASTEPFADAPDQMILSPDGRTLACRTRETIRLYPIGGGPVTVITNDGKKQFTGIAYHPSGAHLAATSNDKTVKLYAAATGQIARTMTWDIGWMRSVAFRADGAVTAMGSDTGKVVVWDVDE